MRLGDGEACGALSLGAAVLDWTGLGAEDDDEGADALELPLALDELELLLEADSLALPPPVLLRLGSTSACSDSICGSVSGWEVFCSGSSAGLTMVISMGSRWLFCS